MSGCSRESRLPLLRWVTCAGANHSRRRTGRRLQVRLLRTDTDAASGAQGHFLSTGIFSGRATGRERGLPVSERVDGGGIGKGTAAGDGVDLRRGNDAWLRLRALL